MFWVHVSALGVCSDVEVWVWWDQEDSMAIEYFLADHHWWNRSYRVIYNAIWSL